MDLKNIIKAIDKEWEDEGFLGKLRGREVDLERMEILISVLKQIKIKDSEKLISRDLVRLLWFIPEFMDWQRDSLKEIGEDSREYQLGCGEIRELVQDVLGNP